MRVFLVRATLLLAIAAIVPACGGGGGGGGGGAKGGGGGSAKVGDATGTANGGIGGDIDLEALIDFLIGENPVPPAPAAPAIPTTGTAIDDSDVAADFSTAGDILIDGTVTTSPAGVTRTITSTGGDIIIRGTLVGGDQASLILNAPAGTIYVIGSIRTDRIDNDPDGSSAGNVTLDAGNGILVRGKIDASGQDDDTGGGGTGGIVDLSTTDGPIWILGGTIDVSGGDASGPTGPNVGGNGGEIFIGTGSTGSPADVQIRSFLLANGGNARDDDAPVGGLGGIIFAGGVDGVDVTGTVSATGGSATTSGTGATGGTGGDIEFGALGGDMNFFGSFPFGGGNASSGDGNAIAGNAGTFINTNFPADNVNFPKTNLNVSGGDGSDNGGDGGVIVFTSAGTDMVVRGNHDLSGGKSGDGSMGGDGGLFVADAGSGGTFGSDATIDASGGATSEGVGGPGGVIVLVSELELFSFGPLTANGGASSDGDGGPGGAIIVVADSLDPTDTLFSNGILNANGGNAGGDGDGGDGGEVELITDGAGIEVTKAIAVRGGNGAGATGNGGTGGGVLVTSDGTAEGDIVLASSIDASGGNGQAAGGNGRNDGDGAVANATTTGDFSGGDMAIEVLAGAADQTINRTMRAEGGSVDAAGGDARFIGTGTDAIGDLPAASSFAGDGTGDDGDVEF